MAKTSTAKAGAKQAAPAKAAEAAQEPAKAAKRASKAAPAAPAAAKKKPATTARPAAKKALKAPARPAAKAAAKPAARATRAKGGANVATKAARKLVAKTGSAERRTIEDGDKPRLVRDSFTMPEPEYALLAEVKQACLKAGFEIKKSELLRIGVALVGQLDMATLHGVLASLPQLKTGRPRSR